MMVLSNEAETSASIPIHSVDTQTPSKPEDYDSDIEIFDCFKR